MKQVSEQTYLKQVINYGTSDKLWENHEASDKLIWFSLWDDKYFETSQQLGVGLTPELLDKWDLRMIAIWPDATSNTLPSGYLTVRHGKWPIEIDGLPIENGWIFPWLC